jgi:tetratricopeptide (TPR) repeat protein
MFKFVLRKEKLFLIGVLCIAPLTSYGQTVGGDLGSSSCLFKGKTTKPKTTTTTPAASKPKASKPVARKATPAPVRKATTAANRSTRNSRPETNSNSGDKRIITISSSRTNANIEEQFESALDEGNGARDNRNYTAAERSYKRAQSIKPRDSRASYGLGNLYSDQQRWEEAEKAYRSAITLDPDVPETYVALSFVLSQPIAGADVADRYVEAETMARKAIGLDKSNGVAFDQLGTTMELQGKIGADTESAYRRASEMVPGYALPYAHLGRLKGRNNQNAEAQKAFQTAIQLSKDVPSMILVADVLQVSRAADAEQLLRRALQLDPRNPMALFLLSDVLVRQQKLVDAEKVLRDSVQISQNSYSSNSKLGDLLLQLKRYNEAEASFLRALDTASPAEKMKLAGLQGFTGIGDGYMKERKFRDAVRSYNRAKQIDPKNQDTLAKISAAEKLAF